EGKIFVPSPSPRPVGTALVLKLELLDHSVAVIKNALVESLGRNGRPGMVVRLPGVGKRLKFEQTDPAASGGDEIRTTAHRYDSGFLQTLLEGEAPDPGLGGSTFSATTMPVRGVPGLMQEVLRVRSRVNTGEIKKRTRLPVP